jgi:hypothetical protein
MFRGAREVLMKNTRTAISRILLAAVAAIAMPLTAEAFGDKAVMNDQFCELLRVRHRA